MRRSQLQQKLSLSGPQLNYILGLLLISLSTSLHSVHGQSLFASLFSFLSRPCNTDPNAERCGMGYVMYTGADGSIDCTERCALFPLFNPSYQCGSCGPVTTRAPSVTSVPTSSPLSAVETPAPANPTSPVRLPTPSAPVTPQSPVRAPSPSTGGDGSYEISIDLVGQTSLLSFSERRVFDETAAIWERIITADLVDVNATDMPAGPRFTGCRYPTVIDDLYICLRVEEDDGPGKVLGYASPQYRRSVELLTISGYINLDVDDVSNLIARGTFDDVFSHEIGHILGIGTWFTANGIAGQPKDKCPYFGPKATAEYKAISNCDILPMENDGKEGDGTYCAHWDEQCLKFELMTGTINLGGDNPLSRITIASLEDLGYKGIDYSSADRFTRFDLGTGCTCTRRNLQGTTTTLMRSKASKEHRHHRKLSEEMRQYAIEKGLDILKEDPRPANGAVGSLFSNMTTALRTSWADSKVAQYVGNWMVTMLVQDDPDGDIYGVHVYNPEYFPS